MANIIRGYHICVVASFAALESKNARKYLFSNSVRKMLSVSSHFEYVFSEEFTYNGDDWP